MGNLEIRPGTWQHSVYGAGRKGGIRGDNKSIIHALRVDRELGHLGILLHSFEHEPLSIPASLPLPFVNFGNLQDLCNKTVAIYDISNKNINRTELKKFVCDQWSDGDIHHTDVEFSRFLAKIIRLYQADPKVPITSREVISIHAALIERLRISEPSFTSDCPYKLRGPLNLIVDQKEYLKLGWTLQAVVIVIETTLVPDLTQQMVRVIRTNISNQPSASIKFDTPSGMELDEDGIIMTLPEALGLVQDLEKREEELFPVSRDESVLDDRLGDEIPKEAAREGYNGPEIQGPSSAWIEEHPLYFHWQKPVPQDN